MKESLTDVKNNTVAQVPVLQLRSRSRCIASVIHFDSLIVFYFLPPHLLSAELRSRLNWNILFRVDINGAKDNNFFRNVVITGEELTGVCMRHVVVQQWRAAHFAKVGSFSLLFTLDYIPARGYFNAQVICSAILNSGDSRWFGSFVMNTPSCTVCITLQGLHQIVCCYFEEFGDFVLTDNL